MAVSRSFVVVVLLSLLSCVLRTAAVNQPYTHHAILTGEQAGTPSTALGAALVSFDGSTGNLDYTIVNNVQDTTVAHIHGAGYPGVSAGVLVPIPGFASGGNATVRGTVNLNSTNADLLQSGQLYFNIHTGEFPNGEIRGQILKIGQQVTTLDANQEGGGVVSTALGYALTTFDSSSKQLSVVLNHNVSGATLAHIHGPAAPGVNAGVLITLAPNATVAQSNPITLTTTLTDDQVTWLNQGLLYYNVHSGVYSGGEIRGQIEPIVNYAGELNGFNDNQTTDEWGVGFVALYGDALLAEVFHTVPDPIAAHIHTGAPFVSGGVTFPFSNPNSPIVQNFTATTDEVQNLVNGSDYFNVHTNAAQAGLIRGQIYPKVAVTGSQPSSSTTATSTSGATTLISSSVAIVLALLSLVL